MQDPIITLIKLNELTLQLDATQARIDRARSVKPVNGLIQLELDRKQTEVDVKRRAVEELKFNIASRN